MTTHRHQKQSSWFKRLGFRVLPYLQPPLSPPIYHMRTQASLDTLLEDILIEIFSRCTILDILRLRLVCRSLDQATRLRPVWLNAIQSLVYQEGLLPYGVDKPLTQLSASELERSAIGAVRLASNLANASPQAKGVALFPDRMANSYITQNLILPGRGAKWFVSVGGGRHLTFWEVLDKPLGGLQAGTWDTSGVILDVVVNKIPYVDAVMALTQQRNRAVREFRTEILAVDPSTFVSGAVLEVNIVHSILSPPGRLRALHGDHVFFYRRKLGMCTIINWKTGQTLELCTVKDGKEPILPFLSSGRCLALEVIKDNVIIVTSAGICVFTINLEDCPAATQDNGDRPRIYPTHSQIFDDEAKTASILIHAPPSYLGLSGEGSTVWPSVTVMVRGRLALSSPVDSISTYLFTPPSPGESPWRKCEIQTRVCDTGPHFCSDIASGPSGRGVWMQREMINPPDPLFQRDQAHDPPEQLVLFDLSDRRRGPSQLEGNWPPRSVSKFWGKTQVLLFPNPNLACTTLDYDDANGRVVIGSFDSKIRIVDYV